MYQAPFACWSRGSRPHRLRRNHSTIHALNGRFADLPVARRVIQALGKTRELFFLADMEEEFEDRGLRFGEQRLEIADMLITLGPGRF